MRHKNQSRKRKSCAHNYTNAYGGVIEAAMSEEQEEKMDIIKKRLLNVIQSTRWNLKFKKQMFLWAIPDILFMLRFCKAVNKFTTKCPHFPEIKTGKLTLKSESSRSENFRLTFLVDGDIDKDSGDMFVSLYLQFLAGNEEDTLTDLQNHSSIVTFVIFDRTENKNHNVARIKCSTKRNKDQGKRRLISHEELTTIRNGYTLNGYLLLGVHIDIYDVN